MSTSNTSSHEKIQKKKKNHRVPHWPGGTPPPQGLELFFSLECGSKLFSQPLQRATTSPQSLGSAEGVEPGGRGAYVTRQTQGQPVGERNAQRNDRERGRRVCIWKVFSARRRGPSLCESDDEWNRKAKCNGVKKNCHVFYQVWRLRDVFKSFRPTSKKPFSNNIKGPQPTARFRQKFQHDSLLSYTQASQYKAFFLSPSTGKLIGTRK